MAKKHPRIAMLTALGLGGLGAGMTARNYKLAAKHPKKDR